MSTRGRTYHRVVDFEYQGVRVSASYSVNGVPGAWCIEDVGRKELLVETEDGRWLPAREPHNEGLLIAAEQAAEQDLQNAMSEG